MSLISVCIASIGRDYLVDCIQSIFDCGYSDFEIIVCDNSPDGRARALTERAFPDNLKIKIVSVPEPNIALARNACVSLAAGKFIAFIDDDERARLGWLDQLIISLESQNVDVVFGPAYPIYAEHPKWADFDGPYTKKPDPRNPILTGATCNAALRAELLTRYDVRFDPAFGATGGEDLDFFTKLHGLGVKFGCAPLAVVEEDIPSHRLTDEAIRSRSIAAGRVYARVFFLRKRRTLHVLYLLLSILKYFALSSAAQTARLTRRKTYWSLRRRAWGNLGRIQALFGLSQIQAYGLQSR